MDLITLLVGIVIIFIGSRQDFSGAGLPLIVTGVCIALFGVVWFANNHFSSLWVVN